MIVVIDCPRCLAKVEVEVIEREYSWLCDCGELIEGEIEL